MESEAYLEPSRTSAMEFLAINYFRKKSSIVDVWLDLKYASDSIQSS